MSRLPGETPEAETERLRGMVQTLGTVVTALSRSLKAAYIELAQGHPEAAREWVANAVPGEVWDGDEWDGTESAQQWADRTEVRT
jgi:hypothetical protein